MSEGIPSKLRTTYYRVKPFIPDGLRMGMRRAYTRRLRKKHAHVWPIDESTGQAPDGWPGWPEGKRFAFVLTHDVEGSAGLERVRELAEFERERKIAASYNLVPEGEYEVTPELVQWLRAGGFEVGVHDLHHDGFLYASHEGFREKARRINGYLKDWNATGFRSAFMMRNLEWIHELDIAYDSSTFDTDPFEPQPDGAGTIFPFEVVGEQGESYVELPYTMPQDSSLFLVLGEQNPSVWLRKLDWIAERGGMALLNVHPDYISFDDQEKNPYTYSHRHLANLLDYLEQRYAGEYWNPLPCELVDWFRASRGQSVPARRVRAGLG